MSEEKAFNGNITEQLHSQTTNEYNINIKPNNYARNLQNGETWGDGLRTLNEQWDDSNTQNGDGCSSKWVVEKGYICSGGNNATFDKWKRCPVGYKHFRFFEHTDFVKCIPETDTYDAIFYITIVVLVIGMFKNLIYKFFLYINGIDKQNNSELQQEQNTPSVQNNQPLYEEEKVRNESRYQTYETLNALSHINILVEGEDNDERKDNGERKNNDGKKERYKNIEFHR